MNPYYQPPSYDAPRDEVRDEPVPSRAEIRPGRRGWYYYLGGFFLLVAGVCLVLSNSLNWHPNPSLPPRAPSAASYPTK